MEGVEALDDAVFEERSYSTTAAKEGIKVNEVK